MTYHSRSAVEFGQFLTRISETVLKGAPMRASLEDVRAHFDADAVVLACEPGGHSLGALHDTALRETMEMPATPGASPVQAFCERYQHMKASCFGADGLTRYTLWVFRERTLPRPEGEEISLCEILVASLARAGEFAARMNRTEVERGLYSDVMDKLSVGVVILDGTGRVVRASAAASQVLSSEDGLHIHGNRMRAACGNEDRQLQATIRTALTEARSPNAPKCRAVSLSRKSGPRKMGVILRPIATSAAPQPGEPAIAVYIRDPELNPEVENDLLRQLFDLTPAEAAVAERLTSGLSLEDAAISLDISRNTARAHLRSIFSKSGITRQMELVRLVLNSAVMLGERTHHPA